jgi:glutamyl-tRNA synthetase
LGNLRTALIAWLVSRLKGGRFLLRIEDLDTPRIVQDSDKKIIDDLHWLGIDWDEEPVYQSQRRELYATAMHQLQEQQQLFECFCSRKELREIASAPHGAIAVYPGTCRDLRSEERKQRRLSKNPAVRLCVPDKSISFVDLAMGLQSENLQEAVGDFVVKRADGQYAYQLAVVVDDIAQGITEVVRGADLLSSTARQIYLTHLLAPKSTELAYWHVPLLADAKGQRMAKRDGSESAESWRNSGKSNLHLVGTFAYQLGLASSDAPLNAKDLLASLNLQRLTAALSASMPRD